LLQIHNKKAKPAYEPTVILILASFEKLLSLNQEEQTWASAGGDKTGICPPVNWDEKQSFLENLKSAV